MGTTCPCSQVLATGTEEKPKRDNFLIILSIHHDLHLFRFAHTSL